MTPVLTQHYAMPKRNLVYTEVARGRRLIVPLSQKNAEAIAVYNASGHRRWSKPDEWFVGAETDTARNTWSLRERLLTFQPDAFDSGDFDRFVSLSFTFHLHHDAVVFDEVEEDQIPLPKFPGPRQGLAFFWREACQACGVDGEVGDGGLRRRA